MTLHYANNSETNTEAREKRLTGKKNCNPLKSTPILPFLHSRVECSVEFMHSKMVCYHHPPLMRSRTVVENTL